VEKYGRAGHAAHESIICLGNIYIYIFF